MGSQEGLTDEKINALAEYESSDLYSDAEKVALRYSDAITYSDQDVSAELFAEVQQHFDDDAIVELTAVIAFENASSKFNRALRVEAMGLYSPEKK